MERHPTAPEPVKILFALRVDDEGWPPVSTEGVWAIPLGADRYRLDNTPWFARNVACEDVVEGRPDADGVLWAMRRLEWGGHLTIRVVPLRSGPLEGKLQPVLDAFAPLGVSGEGAQPAYPIVALDVPPGAPLLEIKTLLQAGKADGRWDYEEGCVSDDWVDL